VTSERAALLEVDWVVQRAVERQKLISVYGSPSLAVALVEKTNTDVLRDESFDATSVMRMALWKAGLGRQRKASR
jgi:hypothetical protein